MYIEHDKQTLHTGLSIRAIKHLFFFYAPSSSLSWKMDAYNGLCFTFVRLFFSFSIWLKADKSKRKNNNARSHTAHTFENKACTLGSILHLLLLIMMKNYWEALWFFILWANSSQQMAEFRLLISACDRTIHSRILWCIAHDTVSYVLIRPITAIKNEEK